LELPPEVEAGLAAQAATRGLKLGVYLESLLKQYAAMKRPVLYLPLKALTRESYYQDHD
jgi:hypothetical protein